MAFYDTIWYCNFGNGTSTGYFAVPQFAVSTVYAAGQLVRQLAAPTVGNERVFVVIVAGTSGASEPAWTVTRGAKTTSGGVTFQEVTGASAVNGDLTDTPTWATAKAIGTPTLGAIIKRNNAASYQICTTAGTMAASEPSFSDTAGVTTNDGTSVWTSLGPVSNFTGGQAPHARLGNACATNWYAWGNTVYVGDDHAESQTAVINIAPAATNASLTGKILCHNHSGSYPPTNLTTGATISTTASNSISFNAQGPMYYYGLTFAGAVGTAATGAMIQIAASNPAIQTFDNCSFKVPGTGSGAIINVGSPSGVGLATVFLNTTVSFGHIADYISVLGNRFIWQNTGQILASGSLVPNAFFSITNAFTGVNEIILEALDLSQLTGSLLSTPSQVITKTNLMVKDCKLNASMTFATPTVLGVVVQNVRSDSSATAYKSARYAYEGVETTETSITRVGGAADPTGQAQSRKIVTTANSSWLRPFNAEPYAIWNTRTAANVTVTVYGTVNAGAVPNNDDIWLEVEYLGSSATPLGTIVTTTKATLLSSNAAVASDGSSWNGGGSGAGWSPFKLVATLSSPQPAMAGYLEARVRAAKASTTFYIDPIPVLT